MAKQVKLGINVDTSEAMRNLGELGKMAQEAGKLVSGIGEGGVGIDGELSSSQRGGIDSEFYRILKSMEDSTRSLQDVLENLDRSIKNNNSNQQRQTQSQTSKSEPTIRQTREEPKKDTQNKDEKDSKKDLDALGKAIGAAVAGRGVLNYIGSGMESSKGFESESYRVYGRTGAYGSDFNRGRTESHKKGSPYGFSIYETMGVEDNLLNLTGFTNMDRLSTDTNAFLSTGKAYGLDPNSLTQGYGSLVKAGAYEQGQGEEYSNVIASTIKSSGMVGREGEQVRAIQQLEDSILNSRLNVTADEFKGLLGLHTELGRMNESLKGERGAETIGKMDSLLDPNSEMALRMVGYGGDLGYGPDALIQAKKMLDNGFSDPETLKAFAKGMNAYMPDSSTQALMIQRESGATMEESLIIRDLINKGDYAQASEIAGRIDKEQKLGDYYGSKVSTQERYDVERENARAATGNMGNAMLSPFRGLYNAMPTGLQGGVDIGKNILYGAVGSGVFSLAKNAVLGSPKDGSGLGGIRDLLSKGGLGTKIGTEVADDVLIGGSKLGGVAGKVGSIAGKAGGIAGKALPYLPAAIGGVKAIGDVSEGDFEGASGNLGKGLGSTGGILGGAKVGALAGTAIAPGVGTLIGGIGGAIIGGAGGGWLGEKLGKGAYSALSSTESYAAEGEGPQKESVKRADGLLDKQEQLLRKEEQLFDKFLGESGDRGGDHLDGFNAKLLGNEDNNLVAPTASYGQFKDGMAAALSGGESSVGGGFNGPEGTGLGSYTRRFEVGKNGNGGMVSSGRGDPLGGISYGIPQFSTKQGSAKAFVNDLMAKDPKYEKYFKGKSPGTAAFSAGWKQAYADHGAEFEAYQLKNVQATHFEPWIKMAKKNTGIDFNRSRALQEAAWSISVQHGGASSKYLTGIKSGMSDDEIISRLYKNRHAKAAVATSSRWREEEKIMKGLVGQPAVQLYGTGSDYIPKDQYAYLHKEEAVLNRHDAKAYREGRLGDGGKTQTSTINLNVNITGENGTDPELVNMIKMAVSQAVGQLGINDTVALNRAHIRVQN